MKNFTFILLFISFPVLSQNLYPYGTEYPLALYALYSEYGEASNNNWNCGHTYQELPTTSSYFQTCEQNNLHVMARLSYLTESDQKWSQPESITINEISTLSAHSNISWWDMPEELRYWYDSEFEILQNYTPLTRLHDPNQRPNYMYIPGHYKTSNIENYVPYLDIIPASCYTNYQELPHAYVRWSIERTKEAVFNQGFTLGKDYLNNEKTIMAILELYENNTPLTSEGTWHDFWLAIACDIKGIVVYSHAYRNSSSSLNSSWNKLNDATEVFKSNNLGIVMLEGNDVPIDLEILSGPMTTPSFQINTEVIQFPSIKILAKEWNDTTYVICVNSSTDEVAYKLSDFGNLMNVVTNVFNQNVQFENGEIIDSLPPLGVSFFKMRYDETLGTNELNDIKNQVMIYPNPSSNNGSLMIKINSELSVNQIKIFDLNGKLIEQYKFIPTDLLQIKNKMLNNGAYVISLMNNNEVLLTNTFIIN